MSVPKILTDLFVIRQGERIKNPLANIVHNVFVVKEVWQNIKKLV